MTDIIRWTIVGVMIILTITVIAGMWKESE